MQNPKRIAILHYAAPPVVGGVETTIFHHSRFLAENGFKVDVIAGRGKSFHPKVNFHLIPEIDSRNTETQKIGNALASGRITEEFDLFRDRIVASLKPILSLTKVCIVHNAVTLHKNLALTAALRKISDEKVTKLIAWCHDFAWQDDLYTAELHPGYPWDLLRTTWPEVKYVVVSDHRRNRLATLLRPPPDQIKVITPGVNITEFSKLESTTVKLICQLDFLNTGPWLLLPARITRRKNIEFGIHVLAELVTFFPEVRLMITGPPGPHNPKNTAYLEDLQALADELEVSAHVHFLYKYGETDSPLILSDECIADLYRLADILFFPSRKEGFGIPILEAGLTRLPVFAADIPTINESAGEWAFRFDPDGDPASVAKAISNYLQRDQAYQLRQRVIRQYSWQNIIQNDLIPLIESFE